MASAQMDSVVLDSTCITVRGHVDSRKTIDFMVSDASTLTDVLNQHAAVFVKSASGSALSTVSIRGGTPEQSAVFWNGLSLSNTLNGNVDLSLLPSLAFDEIRLNASNSVHSGSGATAGSLELKSGKFDTSKVLLFQAGAGSLGAYNAAIKSVFHAKKSRASLVSYIRGGQNNYTVQVGSTPSNTKRLENAAFSMAGMLYAHQIDLKKSNPLNIRLWAQTSTRQIPATLLEAASQKSQIDHSIRLQSDWSKIIGRNEVKLIIGSFLESLQYADSVSQIFSDYAFINNSLLVHYTRRQSKYIHIGIDLESRHFGADADTFYNQTRIELCEGMHVKYERNNWLAHIGTRFVQYTTSTDKPILVSAQLNRRFSKNWGVMTLFSTNYRQPTFNSLYWNPGGKPLLTAEKSTNSEVSIDYSGAHWEVKTNVYSNYIKDQIRWVPGSDGIFEAQQIVDQVQWNRGVELSSTYKIKGVSFETGFTRILSTVKEQSDKWQQTFVPLFQGNAGIGYAKSNWRAHYGLQVVSKRFTDTENKEYLPAYALHNAQVAWHNKALEFKLTAWNLGGLSYTILPFRPNPPRNFQLDITYKLNKNNNK